MKNQPKEKDDPAEKVFLDHQKSICVVRRQPTPTNSIFFDLGSECFPSQSLFLFLSPLDISFN